MPVKLTHTQERVLTFLDQGYTLEAHYSDVVGHMSAFLTLHIHGSARDSQTVPVPTLKALLTKGKLKETGRTEIGSGLVRIAFSAQPKETQPGGEQCESREPCLGKETMLAKKETATSEQTPDVDALLALVKDYYAAALLGEQLTDPTYDEEREFQARMIGLIDRTEKLLDLNTGERESDDERIERHGRQWEASLAEQQATASMWGY